MYVDKPPIDELMHYGMPRRSGRYPWGSGDNPYQHSGDFLSRIDELKKEGYTYTDEKTGKTYTGDTAIAKYFGLSTTQFRAQKSLADAERRALLVDTAKGLQEKGYSPTEIARKMGYTSESSVRSLLNADSEARMRQARATADILKKVVDEKGMIEVGAGVERELGVSKEKLKQALYILEMEGYPTYGGRVPQVTNPGRQTTISVLCPPGAKHKDIYQYDKVNSFKEYTSNDDGETYHKKFTYPESLDSKRLQIRYAEDGGLQKDGVIELRRGVPDLDLGSARYSQVRIMVDGKKYLKGMAVYSDDMPDGVDVIFNTNKSKSVPKLEVLKDIKDDPDNPFGSLIKDADQGGQYWYADPKTGKQKLGLINKRANEGDWTEWKDKLPSQFLGKQSLTLAKKQLGLSIADKQSEFDEINSLTNPTVKKSLLQSFADDCDGAAVHLKAAALPRQKFQVILPLTSISDKEIYAPNYRDGEKVALVRYPHGGTFEIPILTVNNKIKEGKRIMGSDPTDAVGINSKVAERLSGADFDGDTVMVIPTGRNVKITSTPPLKGLEGFDPKMEYGTVKKGDSYYNASGKKIKVMKNTQTEMGIVSNLITDMTLRGAKPEELARAVRHSMVVIDAEKHKLDYKQSYKDNQIAALKKKYQGHYDEDGSYHEGAATLLSRAKSEKSVLKRKGSPQIDPETGKVSYKEVREEYIDKKGKTQVRTQKSTKMAETDDARTLISDARAPMELLYADYANKMKSMANQARKEMLATGKISYSKQAHETYLTETKHLDAQLNVALKNAPREKQAQLMANSVVKAKQQEYPNMTKSELKKVKQKALTNARQSVGAQRHTITINDKEWEAIQAGAISESKLKQILKYADIDEVKKRAMPRTTTTLNASKIARIKAMKASGYTNATIADQMGISASTVSDYLNGKR